MYRMLNHFQQKKHIFDKGNEGKTINFEGLSFHGFICSPFYALDDLLVYFFPLFVAPSCSPFLLFFFVFFLLVLRIFFG